MVYDIEPGDIYNEKGYFGLSLAHKTEANPNNKKTLKGYSLEKHNRIIKEKDQEIMNLKADSCYIEAARMKGEIADLKERLTIAASFDEKREKEIVGLKAENTAYDKAVSGFFMWLGTKIRENVLLDPDEVKGELKARIKESKEPG